jgi:hypothetical protein
MPKLILNIEALKVESFPIGSVDMPRYYPTTTRPMNTNEPGCRNSAEAPSETESGKRERRLPEGAPRVT